MMDTYSMLEGMLVSQLFAAEEGIPTVCKDCPGKAVLAAKKLADINVNDSKDFVIGHLGDIWNFLIANHVAHHNRMALPIPLRDNHKGFNHSVIADQVAHVLIFNPEKAYQLFWDLCSAFSVQIEDIYRVFMANITLAWFRKDNGYEAGTYKENWWWMTGAGKFGFTDDRAVAMQIAKTIKSPAAFQQQLYAALDSAYSVN